jgi:hypothetical protein
MRFKEFLKEATSPVWTEKTLDSVPVKLSDGEEFNLILFITYRNDKAHSISVAVKTDGSDRNPDGTLRAMFNEPQRDYPLGGIDVDADDVQGILSRIKANLKTFPL